jgi:carbon-monoxide dehydrogenase medium subunit
MKEIEYRTPKSLPDAVACLHQADGRGRVLAGGTDILVQLRERLRDADVLIDVKKIPELTEIARTPSGGWSIGAAVSCAKIEDHAELSAAYPGLRDAVHIIGGWQIKTRASLGGNLCTSSPAADSLPALIAYGAVARLVGPAGERRAPIEDFCTGPGVNVLSRGELVVAIELPARAANSAGCYIRFIPRYEMDIAVAGAGTLLEVEDGVVRRARIALGAVAPTPVVAAEAGAWLAGKPASLESFAKAGELARGAARPISDMRAPADYRVHLVGVLVKRSLSIALRRIKGEAVNPLVDGHM